MVLLVAGEGLVETQTREGPTPKSKCVKPFALGGP